MFPFRCYSLILSEGGGRILSVPGVPTTISLNGYLHRVLSVWYRVHNQSRDNFYRATYYKIVDLGGYKRAGNEYFVILLHVSCAVVSIKSDED